MFVGSLRAVGEVDEDVDEALLSFGVRADDGRLPGGVERPSGNEDGAREIVGSGLSGECIVVELAERCRRQD